jgi:hypothetical protein
LIAPFAHAQVSPHPVHPSVPHIIESGEEIFDPSQSEGEEPPSMLTATPESCSIPTVTDTRASTASTDETNTPRTGDVGAPLRGQEDGHRRELLGVAQPA